MFKPSPPLAGNGWYPGRVIIILFLRCVSLCWTSEALSLWWWWCSGGHFVYFRKAAS